MFGFITGLTSEECSLCDMKFVAGTTGSSHPYEDYSCKNTNCNWQGIICKECKKICPICKSKLQSSHEMYNNKVLY